ncbi:MAG: hypothetical protein ACYSUU_05090 [Planctomycetota bacterium]|jgi:hypothetical protein
MRELFIAILTLGLGAGAQASIIGTTYTDATNDLFDSSLTNLDLVSARISNDATHLHLSVTVRGDVSTTTWGDYMVFIDSTTSLSASERDDAEGGRWNQKETGTPDLTRATSGTVNWTFSLESLGLAIGDTFHFDVATIGSSDGSSSVDLLSTSSIRPGWGFDEDSTLDLTYTVAGSTAVPGIGGVAALAGLGLARRRRTR